MPRRCTACGPVADGRLQKYCGAENGWPSSREPTAWPSRSMRLPVAWLGKRQLPDERDDAGIEHARHEREQHEHEQAPDAVRAS